MDEVIKKGEAPGSGGRSLEHGSDPRSGHVPSRLLVELRLAGEAAEHMHVPRMRALAWRSVVEGYATNRILGHFERLLSACDRWLQTPPGSGAGSGDSGRVVLPDLVLHRADEEFVVNALDAPGTAGDATHLVLDPFGADAADQRDHPCEELTSMSPALISGLAISDAWIADVIPDSARRASLGTTGEPYPASASSPAPTREAATATNMRFMSYHVSRTHFQPKSSDPSPRRVLTIREQGRTMSRNHVTPHPTPKGCLEYMTGNLSGIRSGQVFGKGNRAWRSVPGRRGRPAARSHRGFGCRPCSFYLVRGSHLGENSAIPDNTKGLGS